MNTMQRTIFVDVDDTLVRSVGSTRVPMPAVIGTVRRLAEQGVQLYLWSTGGVEYCRDTAIELNLADSFVGYLTKPHAYIDDQSVDEWRGCRHVLPGNAADLTA